MFRRQPWIAAHAFVERISDTPWQERLCVGGDLPTTVLCIAICKSLVTELKVYLILYSTRNCMF